jgi:hypothetical protein
MNKPKGGRGCKAPYETQQIRIPKPIAEQVETLKERYQNYRVAGGDPMKAPHFLADEKPVDKFIDNEKQARAVEILKQALKLKANSGGAIKKEIEKALILLDYNLSTGL